MSEKSPAAFGTQNQFAPKQGAKVVPRVLDFSTEGTQAFDFLKEIENNYIDFIQTVHFDNTQNPSDVILEVPVTQQRLTLPGNSFGTLPIISLPNLQFKVTTTAGAGVQTRLLFMNVPMPHFVSKIGAGENDPGSTLTSFEDVALNNGSITAVLAANLSRRSALLVAAPSNSVNIRVGGPSTGATFGAELQPGQAISIPASAAIYAYAGAAGQSVSGFWIGD